VESLYRETFETEREAPREEVEGGLEAALESLKRSESGLQGLSIALALIFTLLPLAAAFSGNPSLALAGLAAGGPPRLALCCPERGEEEVGLPGNPGRQGRRRAVEGGSGARPEGVPEADAPERALDPNLARPV